MDAPELLPCPFCGGKPFTRERQDEDLATHDIVTWKFVGCSNCDVSFDIPDGYDCGTAQEQWNTRSDLCLELVAAAYEAAANAADNECDEARKHNCPTEAIGAVWSAKAIRLLTPADAQAALAARDARIREAALREARIQEAADNLYASVTEFAANPSAEAAKAMIMEAAEYEALLALISKDKADG